MHYLEVSFSPFHALWVRVGINKDNARILLHVIHSFYPFLGVEKITFLTFSNVLKVVIYFLQVQNK